MASLDASVLANIPDYAPRPVQAIAKAYQLKDMIDDEQLDRFKVGQEKREQDEQDERRAILAGQDLSTPQGWMRASQAASKAGFPDLSMDLMRNYQDLTSVNTKNTSAQLDVQTKEGALRQQTADLLSSQAADLINVFDTKGPAMAAAEFQRRLPQVLQQLPNTPWGQQARQQLTGMLSNGVLQNPQQFRSALAAEVAASQQGRATLTQNATLTKDQAETDESRARTKALEGGKLVPVQQADGTTVYMPASQAAGQQVGKAGQTSLTQGGQQLAADMASNGVPFPSGLGYGSSLRDQVLNRLAAQGTTSDQIRRNGLNYYLTKQEIDVVGRQNARIKSAATALTQSGGLIDQALDASAGVDFSKFKLAARAKGWQLDQISDPQYGQLKTALLGVAADYGTVIARGGQNVSSQEAARIVYGPTSFAALLAKAKQVGREIDTTEGASQATVDQLVNGGAVSQPPAGAGAVPGAAPAQRAPNQPAAPAGTRSAGALPPTNAQGWVLMRDAQGNQAYVSQDGKQYQQVQ